jgi:hypothetical protein
MATSNVIPSATPRNGRRGAAVDNDPIVAAIAKFKAADARWLKSLGNGKGCDPAWDALGAAHCALMHTKPTTRAGMVALLDYLAKFKNPTLLWGDDYDGSHERVNGFIRHVRDGLKAAA